MISVSNLTRVYGVERAAVEALKNVNLSIEEGAFVGVTGKSGSGKSTFLHQLALLDEPTHGIIDVNGVKTLQLSEKEKARFRLENFGFVFQDYHLLQEYTALENVSTFCLMNGLDEREADAQAMNALSSVGLAARAHHFPHQLSGGEKQRVAIARAIVNKPKILFADEPTANLDSASSKQVMELFKALNESAGQTAVIVFHEPEYAKYFQRIITMQDGQILSDSQNR